MPFLNKKVLSLHTQLLTQNFEQWLIESIPNHALPAEVARVNVLRMLSWTVLLTKLILNFALIAVHAQMYVPWKLFMLNSDWKTVKLKEKGRRKVPFLFN